MAGADGTILIDSKIDTKGIDAGLSSATKLAAGAATAIGAALATAGVAAIKIGMDFYEGMSQVQSVSRASAEDMERLTQVAKEMGATTKFSARESADALMFMGQAGWSADQMIAGLPGVMNLAAASGESLADVSSIVTDSLFALGMGAEDAAHFADVLAVAAADSNTGVGMMGQTFKYVAPLAGALGYSVEDLSVAIGLMANAGIKADQAGTALRAIFTRLVKPTKQSETAMKELGLAVTNADGSMRPLNDVLVDMREAFSGLTAAEQAQYAAMLGGQEAMSGLLALVNASDDDFNALTESVNNATGAAEEMARIMADNLAGDMEELGGALETLGIQIYEAFDQPMREAVQAAQGAVNQLSDAFDSPEMRGAVDEIAYAFSDMIKAVTSFVADTIPVVINALAGAITHFDEWKGIIFGVVTAIGVYKAGVLLAAAAQKILTAIMSITPWGAAAIAIGAIAGATVGLTAAITKTTKEASEAARQITNLSEAAEANAKSVAEEKNAFDARREVMDANAQRTQQLIGILEDLGNKTNRTAAGEKLLSEAIAELNEMYPGLNLSIDNHTNAIDKTIEATKELTAVELARQELALAEDEKTAALKRQQDASNDLTTAQEALNTAIAERDVLQARVDDFAAGRIKMGLFAYLELTQSVDVLNESIDTGRALVDEYGAAHEAAGVDVEAATQKAVTSKENLTEAENDLAETQEKVNAQLAALSNRYDPLNEAAENYIGQVREIIKANAAEAEDFAKSQRAIDTAAASMVQLALRAEELSGKIELTADEQAELAAIGLTLNSEITGLNLQFDEQGRIVSHTAEEINAYAEAQAAQLRLTDAQERLTEIFQAQTGAIDAVADANGRLEASRAEEADILARITALEGENGEKKAENKEAIADLNDQYQIQIGITADLETEIANLTAQEEAYGAQLIALGFTVQEAEAIIAAAREQGIFVGDEAVAAEKRQLEERKKLSEDLATAQNKLVDEMTKSYERYAEQTQNMMDVIDTKSKLSMAQAQKNMEENTRIMEAWGTNMEALKGRFESLGLDEALLNQLRNLGPEQSKLIQELTTSSDEKLQAFAATWEKGGASAMGLMEQEFEAGKPGISSAAKAIIDEVVLGMTDNPEIEAAAQKMIADAAAAAGISVDENNFKESGQKIDANTAEGVPVDKKTEEAAKTMVGNVKTATDLEITTQNFADSGKKIDTDTATGTTDNANLVDDAAKTVVSGAYTAASNQVTTSNFAQIGYQMDQGMADGLRNNQSIVTSAAEDVARAAYAAAKAALEIQSPSKKFAELGEFSSEGVGVGFVRGMSGVKRTVAESMDEMYATLEHQSARAILRDINSMTGNDAQASGGTVIIEELVIQTESLNDELDVREVGRQLGEEINREKRYRGVV